jgi:hypothetical protein
VLKENGAAIASKSKRAMIEGTADNLIATNSAKRVVETSRKGAWSRETVLHS